MKALRVFGCCDGCKEFCLSGTCDSDGLDLAATGDCTTGQEKSMTSGGTSVTEVVSMGSINEASKAKIGCSNWEHRQVDWQGQSFDIAAGQSGVAMGNAPMTGLNDARGKESHGGNGACDGIAALMLMPA